MQIRMAKNIILIYLIMLVLELMELSSITVSKQYIKNRW